MRPLHFLISYNSNYHVPLNILQQQTVSEKQFVLKKALEPFTQHSLIKKSGISPSPTPHIS